MTVASILTTIGALLAAWTMHRQARHVRYLEAAAGDRNMWNVRCSACLHPLRDQPTISYLDAGPLAGMETVSHFHADPRPCAAIGRNRLLRRETPDA